jgi:hypothetical protein
VSGRRRGARALIWGAAVWVLAGFALFLVVRGLDHHQRRLFDTLKSSETTTGILVAKDTANHDSFTYSYHDQLGHRHLNGDGGEGQEQGDPANLAVGSQLTVWFSPEHPDVSCYCTPSENTRRGFDAQELIVSQLLAVGLGAAAGTVRWHKGSGASEPGRRNVVRRRS